MMFKPDTGFPSKVDGSCMICDRNYTAGTLIATTPREYHKTTRKGNVLRFGHVECVNKQRQVGQ